MLLWHHLLRPTFLAVYSTGATDTTRWITGAPEGWAALIAFNLLSMAVIS